MHKSLGVGFATLFLLTACNSLTPTTQSGTVSIDLRNAAVDFGNINSGGASLGDIYAYNIESRADPIFVFNMMALGTGLFGVAEDLQGSNSANAVTGIAITGGALVQENLLEIKAQIATSLTFILNDFRQVRYHAPTAILSHPYARRAPQATEDALPQIGLTEAVAPFLGDENYRFILVVREYRGSTLTFGWNIDPEDASAENSDSAVASASVTVAGQTARVIFRNTESVTCSGDNNVCIIGANVWSLDADGNFHLDAAHSNQGFVQRAFSGSQ